MKKLLFLLALVPFLVNAQTPGNQTTLIDLSKYHDDDRIMEMVDENISDITNGTYTIPLLRVTGITPTPTVLEITTIVTIDSTKIVGTAAGDIGHASGAILVAAPGSDYTLEFVSAVIIYDHLTADYAGGGDDNVIQLGTVTQTAAIAGADLLEASGDKIVMLTPLAAVDLPMTVGTTINLQGTALTNDSGTAKGSLRVHITYRRHTTGL